MDNTTNPLMASLKLPGRIFQLPSKGLFYVNGELAANVKDGEVHVRPMSAMDEIDMKNPDQLFSGQAVESVFKNCVDGVLKPSELLSKDVDALMVFLRAVTYGPAYEFSARHICESAKEHTYVADVEEMISNMNYIDATVAAGEYNVTLSNGQVIRLHPARYKHVVELVKENENVKEITPALQKKNLLMMLFGIIDSVDGNINKENIEEWIKALPPFHVKRIADQIEKIDKWGPKLTWTCNCKDCGEDFNIEIPINPVSFFTE